jgi:hypothetical protein
MGWRMLGDPGTPLLGETGGEACREVGRDLDRWCIPRHHQRPSGQRVEARTRGARDDVSGEAVGLVRVEYVIDPVTVLLAEIAAIHR